MGTERGENTLWRLGQAFWRELFRRQHERGGVLQQGLGKVSRLRRRGALEVLRAFSPAPIHDQWVLFHALRLYG
jgi:hypothetical protein